MTELIIEKALLTDVGRKRQQNEDSIGHFEPADPQVLATSGRLYIVADGVGGGAAGEVASEYAVEKVLHAYYQSDEPDLGVRLKAAAAAANRDLYNHVEQHPAFDRMGTTLVAAAVRGTSLVICNVGDSRAYLVRKGTITQITHDHSLVARLVEEGSITAAEAENHPRRNVVLRSLGADAKVYPDLFQESLQLGDQILLCSDGLTRHVTDAEILGVLSRTRPERAAKQLVELANVRGGKDNISVIVLRAAEAVSLQALADRLAGRGAPREPEFDDLLDTASRRQAAAPIRPSRRRLWAGLAAALGLLVLAGLAGLALFLSGRDGEEATPTAPVVISAAPTSTSLPAVTLAIIAIPPTETPMSTEMPSPLETPTGTARSIPTVTPSTSSTPTGTATPTPTPTHALSTSEMPGPTDAALPAVTPTALLGDTRTRPADGMLMVYAPGGEFPMGSDDGEPIEGPVHTVDLDAFWIDRTEVTNAQFRGCVEAGACRAPAACDGGAPAFDDGDQAAHPVVCVSWRDAESYCGWAGGRLPTEAEWEYAARGMDGRAYPWASVGPACSLANYGSCVGHTTEVGNYAEGASWCGALDLAGNVWEWVADWYGDYAEGQQKNPRGPDRGQFRVLRGGAWGTDPSYMRSANRHQDRPDARSSGIGFRCAMGAE